MKLAWISSAALALGVSVAVPSMAHADNNWRHDNGRDRVRIERPRVEVRRDVRIRVDDRVRDFDDTIRLNNVPRNVLDTLHDEFHGRIVGEVQYVHRDGKFFYRFQVDTGGRRDADASVRIGENGRLLSVEEAAQCDPGHYDFRNLRR
jgi:hypothetical protein